MGLTVKTEVRLNRKELGKLKRRVQGLHNAHVDIGFFGGKPHPTNEEEGLTIAEVAAINEFGLGVPERAFMRLTMFEHKQKVRNDLARGITKLFHGQMTSHRLLKELGRRMRDQMRLEIALFDTPPNSPETIEKKGFNAPLVETGSMLEDVDFRVNK